MNSKLNDLSLGYMLFNRIEPDSSVSDWIECFWIIENDDPKQVTQKIIPDGFPEIIFHYADPYEINLDGKWEIQGRNLIAGQIRKFFHLRNTSKASMLGIKLKPASLTQAFSLKMNELTDKVYSLDDLKNKKLNELQELITNATSFESKIECVSGFFGKLDFSSHLIHNALKIIFDKRGLITVAYLADQLNISERQLERIFNQYVGLSPKFYIRVIRFSTIFQLKEQGDPSWVDLTYESGYSDQSHFIKNFKAFTGEDPSQYGFDKQNMANFFMKKK